MKEIRIGENFMIPGLGVVRIVSFQTQADEAILTAKLLRNERHTIDLYAIDLEIWHARTWIPRVEWISRYGGQYLLDAERLDVVPCFACADAICHGWKVVPREHSLDGVPFEAGRL